MLFYMTLLVAGLFAALFLVWVFKLIRNLVGRVKIARHGGPQHGPTHHLEDPMMRRTIIDTPTPWGSKDHSTPSNLARTHPALPSQQSWEWSTEKTTSFGHRPDHEYDDPPDPGLRYRSQHGRPMPVENQTDHTGPPNGDNSRARVAKKAKVTRKTARNKRGFKRADKPWGW